MTSDPEPSNIPGDGMVFAPAPFCPTVAKRGGTCLCRPRCKACGYGEHDMAHHLPQGSSLYHKFDPIKR